MKSSTGLPIQLRASMNIDRGGLRGREAIVSQMADDLRVYSTSRGSITETDMALLGWTTKQLQLFGADARRMAIKLAASRQ